LPTRPSAARGPRTAASTSGRRWGRARRRAMPPGSDGGGGGDHRSGGGVDRSVGAHHVALGSGGCARGPNWVRNRAVREKKKRSAQRASVSAGAGVSGTEGGLAASPVGAGCSSRAPVVPDLVRDNQEGFWNSCSLRLRQELVDSKARMHIAENVRRAKEAEERIRQMESPEALLRRAMAMVTVAEECAKKGNDSKVAGWAQTVATSYAESIARSAPSSVPSYASVVSGSSASSVSVDGTKRGKPQKQEYTVLEHRKRINGAGTPAQMEAACDVLAAATNLPTADKARLMNFAAYRRQAICGPQVFA